MCQGGFKRTKLKRTKLCAKTDLKGSQLYNSLLLFFWQKKGNSDGSNFAKNNYFYSGFFLKNIYSLWKLHFWGFPSILSHLEPWIQDFRYLIFLVSKYAKNNGNNMHYDPNGHCNFAIMMMFSVGFFYKPYLRSLKTLFPMVSNNFESSGAGFSDYLDP